MGARALLSDALEDGRQLDEPDVEAAAAAALAEVLIDAGSTDDAAGLVARYAELRPLNGRRWLLEARLANARGDAAGAVERMERARDAYGERWTRENAEALAALRGRAGAD